MGVVKGYIIYIPLLQQTHHTRSFSSFYVFRVFGKKKLWQKRYKITWRDRRRKKKPLISERHKLWRRDSKRQEGSFPLKREGLLWFVQFDYREQTNTAHRDKVPGSVCGIHGLPVQAGRRERSEGAGGVSLS